MAKIKKTKVDGALVYPATIFPAVKDPNTGQTLTEKLSELGSEVMNLGSSSIDLLYADLVKSSLTHTSEIADCYLRHDTQTIQPLSGYKVKVYEIKGGEAFNIQGGIAQPEYFGVIGFSSDVEMTDLSIVSPNGQKEININLYAPKKARYAYINHFLTIEKLDMRHILLEGEVQDMIDKSSALTVSTIVNGTSANYKKGYYLYANGGEKTNSAWGITDYIECKINDVIKWTCLIAKSDACLCLYDKDKNFITYTDAAGWVGVHTTTISDSNCAFLRASFNIEASNNVNIISINGESVFTPKDEFVGLEQNVLNLKESDEELNYLIDNSNSKPLVSPRNLVGIPSYANISPSSAKIHYRSYNPLVTASMSTDIRTEEDAYPIFGYHGNAYKVTIPGTSYQWHISTKKQLLGVEGITKLWMNIELYTEDENVYIDVLGLLGDSTTISPVQSINLKQGEVKKVCIELDLSNASDTSYFGARIMSRGYAPNAVNKTIHVGRIAIWDYKCKKIDYNDDKALSDVKIVTIGDSITAMQTWQQYVCESLGCYYSMREVSHGKNIDGIECPSMGVGGSTYWPFGESSIYNRANYAYKYNGDIYILFGGTNDYRTTWNVNLAWGTIDDAPYTGSFVEESEFAEYISKKESGNYEPNELFDSITYYSVVKGTIKRMIENHPTSKLYIMTMLQHYTDSHYKRIASMNRIIKECADMYSVKVIDLFSDSGITWANQSSYMMEDKVHPTGNGGKRIADCVINAINSYLPL